MDKQSLAALIASGYGNAEDFNCAEKLLHGANIVYRLQLDEEAMKLLAAYGGGMGVEHLCGAVAAAVAVLGKLYVVERAHESDRIKRLASEFLDAYQTRMHSILCRDLKAEFRTEEEKCLRVILAAAEVLDQIVQREGLPAKAVG